jgi:hypothetical protein
VDVYSATFTAMFGPLPSAQCKMEASTRAAFESRDGQIEAALDPILFEHRDMMYANSLETPLALLASSDERAAPVRHECAD